MSLKEFKNSIAKELLKRVLGIYFIITFFMTLIHFILEYYYTKDNIKQELTLVVSTFENSLKRALWNFDDMQIKSIASGILKLSNVKGIEIYDKNTKEIFFNKQNLINRDIFYIEKDLYFKRFNKLTYVGTIKIVSTSEVIFNRVKIGFYIIFFNALIKSLILTILFFIVFKKYLIKPLYEVANKISEIDLEHISNNEKITIKNNKKDLDEISFLLNKFNIMINKLYTSIQLQKKAQNRLFETEKMVSLGEMVAGVAHEINTPIGIALTSSSSCKSNIDNIINLYKNDDLSEEEFEKFLDDIKEYNYLVEINLKKAVEIIKSFKQVSVDQSSEAIRKFNFYNYLQDILISLKNKLKKKHINVVIDCNKDLIVTNYAGAISQIFTNLIMNSLIHGFENKDSGKIIIKIYEIENNMLEIIYEDDGKKIDEKTYKKIFDPFYTTKRNKGGSGLGMSIVYNLVVNKLNGEIEIIKKDIGIKLRFNIQKNVEIKNENN